MGVESLIGAAAGGLFAGSTSAEVLKLVLGMILQAALQPAPLFFELNFLGRKFFEADDVALLLQIERRNLIAHAGQILRRGKSVRLGLAQSLLLLPQILFDFSQCSLSKRQRLAMPFERCLRRLPVAGNYSQFSFGYAPPLLRLGHVGQRLGILRRKLAQTLLIEMDAALVPADFTFQLQPALLHRADAML